MRLFIAICLIVIVVAAPASQSSLSEWAMRVLSNPEQPEWKQTMAQRALKGDHEMIRMAPTQYSDKDYLDPGTGGGPVGCTWFNPDGRRLGSVKLRYGMIAADLRYHKTGTVMFADKPYWHTWIVADCGPGVRGRDRVDVYCPDTPTWQHYRNSVRGRITVHVLGRITRAQVVAAYRNN